MVTRRPFLRNESGIAMTEALITMPLVMLVFAAFVEFGYAMFQWNQTVKALHFGARLAAVSSSVAGTFDPASAFAAPTVADVGLSVPAGASWSCSGSTCGDGLKRIVYGSARASSCQPLGAGVRHAMCHLNPLIGTANVVVTYEASGLGYYGRPMGAVVTIRMEVQNITFKLPIIGALLGLDGNVTIPAMPVTVTSEDLETDSGA